MKFANYSLIISTLLIASNSIAITGGSYAEVGEYKSNIILFEQNCSGTVVGKNLILTAAHCVTPFLITKASTHETFENPGVKAGKTYQFTTADWSDAPKQVSLGGGGPVFYLTVSHVYVHPSWEEALKKHPNDIQAVALEKDVSDIAIIQVKEANLGFPIAEFSWQTVKVKDLVIMTGNGCDLDKEGNNNNYEKRLQFSKKLVASVGAAAFVLPVESISENKNDSSGPSGVCTGDSGGPTYIKVRKGNGDKRLIVGVNSFRANEDPKKEDPKKEDPKKEDPKKEEAVNLNLPSKSSITSVSSISEWIQGILAIK